MLGMSSSTWLRIVTIGKWQAKTERLELVDGDALA